MSKFLIRFVIGLAVLLIIGFVFSVNFYTDWLWFDSLGFSSVFWTMALSSLGLRLLVGMVFAAFLFLNLILTRKTFRESPSIELAEGQTVVLSPRLLTFVFAGVAVFVGLIAAGIVGEQWQTVLRYIHQTSFGISDPIFGNDLSLYIFGIPFLRFIQQNLMVMTILTLLGSGTVYFMGRAISFNKNHHNTPAAVIHLSVLAAMAFFILAWGYRLGMYELLSSSAGVVFGAGYTDVTVRIPVFRVLFYLAALIGILGLINIFLKRTGPILWGVGLLLVASIVLNGIYPAVVQQFRVTPNEFSMERPYLEHSIEFTRRAYNLEGMEEEQYEPGGEIDAGDIDDYLGTLNNLRLWDYRPLLQTFRELQELRAYYNFTSVDTDRYRINDTLNQVMLAGRELERSGLPEKARTWINERLRYTHGYGLVMSPVSTMTPGGMPELFIKDLPPSSISGLEVTRPEIYYGKQSGSYVFVHTDTQEFSYPAGDEVVLTRYEGTGGVPAGSFISKLAFSLRFSTAKILLSDEIVEESRVMYYRNIQERVRRVAPFLDYDKDPYLVLSEGRLFWIQDAYTVLDRYPYSEPAYGAENYIRNSVKIVIDAYNGTLDFYIVDDDDPLIQTYSSIFPDLFQPFEDMPDDLKNHMRYPEDLFRIQTEVLRNFHVQDPQILYNREDAWSIPDENYAGQQQPVEPYYTVMQLPGEEDEEFLLMLPYTPDRRRNMISWVAARSDGENYGELRLYRFPKDSLIYGPAQIEARIDQDPDISRQLSLWDQLGSRVIRGNLLVLPLGEDILYFEPIYLQADQGDIPQLRRIVMAYGDELVMEPTITQALAKLFDYEEVLTAEEDLDPAAIQPPAEEGNLAEIITRGRELYDELTGYEETLQELDRILADLEEWISEGQLHPDQ